MYVGMSVTRLSTLHSHSLGRPWPLVVGCGIGILYDTIAMNICLKQGTICLATRVSLVTNFLAMEQELKEKQHE
jgi:hypothetical protein